MSYRARVRTWQSLKLKENHTIQESVRIAEKLKRQVHLQGSFEKFVDWRQCAAVMMTAAKLRRTAASPRTFQTALVVAPPS
jgi:ABC-type branched-subunit amino acid transport system ATPase component